jgi:hypothetical protein
MTARLLRLLAAAAIAAVTAAGCTNDSPGEITNTASRVLAAQVQHIREVAAIGDYAELRAAVRDLKTLVIQQEREGGVSASRANAIRDAADALLLDARTQLSPSPTPTTESPTPIPTTESPTPSPTPTTESPTPTPTETSSPVVSASLGGRSSKPTSKTSPKAVEESESSSAG